MPMISVVIPVYNSETTIQETIESVLNQTVSDLELIVINDGSTDSTLKIIDGIDDPRLKVFSYPNSGQAVSRNRGIDHGTGDYISFIDADDLWTPNKLDSQLKALQDNPQAAVAYSWTDHIDEAGQFLRPGPHISYSGYVYPQLLLNDFISSGSNPLIRAQALQKIGGFDSSVTPSEDWDMWLRLAKHYHFVAVPSVQILYRQLSQSASCNIWRMEAVSLSVIERAFSHSPELIGDLKPSSLANRYKYLTYRALEGYPDRKRVLTAIKFLGYGVRNEPSLLQKRIIWKVWLKILTLLFLPSPWSHQLLKNQEKLYNLHALMVHIKTELPPHVV